MTPEEARALLERAAGADFVIHLDSDETGPLLVEVGGAPLTAPELTLAAHAPEMAAMIAGMREEWGVAVTYPGLAEVVEWGFDTRDGAEAEGSTLAAEYRVVRRYVTTEEADQ